MLQMIYSVLELGYCSISFNTTPLQTLTSLDRRRLLETLPEPRNGFRAAAAWIMRGRNRGSCRGGAEVGF